MGANGRKQSFFRNTFDKVMSATTRRRSHNPVQAFGILFPIDGETDNRTTGTDIRRTDKGTDRPKDKVTYGQTDTRHILRSLEPRLRTSGHVAIRKREDEAS